MKNLKPLPEIVKPYTSSFVLGVLYLILSNIFYMAIPQVIRVAVDGFESGSVSPTFLPLCAGAIIGLAAAGGLFMFLVRQNIIVASRNIEFDLRNRLYDHLLALSATYYDQSSTGDIMNRLTNDLEAVRRMVGPGTMYMSRNVSRLIFAIIGMLTISPTLTLIALVPFAFLGIAFHAINRTLRSYAREVQELRSDLSSEAQQNFAGIRLLKVFCREEYEKDRFRKRSDAYRNKNLDHAWFMGFTRGIYGIAGEIGIAITLLLGGLWMIEGQFTKGSFIAFSAYQFILAWPILSVPRVLNMVQRGLSSLDRLQEILDVPGEDLPVIPETAGEENKPSSPENKKTDDRQDKQKSSKSNETKPVPNHDITFRDLSFSYSGTEKNVLNNINLQIPAGETLGIAGRTGSGKSTLVQLIPGLYPVPDDSLYIGGVDVNDLEKTRLRQLVSMVPQGDFLFSLKMNENIAFARNHWKMNEVKTAARRSRVHSDIQQFPDEYQQQIGEKGVNLSGGQKQRTSKARALMLDAPIVIMDDPFSNVDSETRDEIIGNLTSVLEEKTWLLITHNLNLLEQTDRIVVLEEGSMVEKGTHQELLQKESVYRELYREQLLDETFDEHAGGDNR